MDILSDATCKVVDKGLDISVQGSGYSFYSSVDLSQSCTAAECVSDHGKAMCKEINGECITKRDGYYLVSGLCMSLGVILLITFIIPKARQLQGSLTYSFTF